MPAFRPNEAELTPYEELGGGIRESWRSEPEDDPTGLLTDETIDTTNAHSRPRRPRYSRRGGRAYPEPSDSELDEHWKIGQADKRTPEEEQIFQEGLAATRQTHLRNEAIAAGDPDEHFDAMRRGDLRWAAALVRDARIADGAAHVLEKDGDPRAKRLRQYGSAEKARALADGRRIDAEELVLSACRKCIFIDRCELVGVPERVVQALGTSTVRKQFVEAMSGDYGSGYVSCESVIDPRK
jgi:hypothetical protein